MRILFAFGWIVAFAGSMSAQTITVNEDPTITRMMEVYVSTNKTPQIFDGFRVQLAATTDRSKIESVEGDFKAKYPGVHIDWVHNKPYYKVRAGAFTSKSSASQFLKSIKADFPDAYIVPDKIKSDEISN
jgi:hypothetical protein